MFFPWATRKSCLLQPADDLGAGGRRADALGLFQTVPQNLVLDKPPCILHRLDQRALVVAGRGLGLLGFDGRIVQLCILAVAHRRKQLPAIALLVGWLPLRECCAPSEIDRLATGRLEGEAFDVERRGRLPVAEVRHEGSEIGSCDHVEQLLLVDRKPRPDLAESIDRVDVGDDGVMAGALQPLLIERAARTAADDRRHRARGLP